MKTRIVFLILLASMSVSLMLGQATDCSDYNYDSTFAWLRSGNIGHANPTGYHEVYMTMYGVCDYESNDNKWCASSSDSYITSPSLTADNQNLSNPLYQHVVQGNWNGGAAVANGATISTGVTGAAAANACSIITGCSITISFNATASGIGTTVNFPPTNLNFTPAEQYQTTCALEQDPTWSGCAGATAGQPPPPCHVGTPIIIDTTGGGFHLTSWQAGVKFDLQGDGHPIQLS